MKITNTTRGDIGIQPDLIVPAGGSLEIDKDAERFLKLGPVAEHIDAGRLVVGKAAAKAAQSAAPKPADPAPAPAPAAPKPADPPKPPKSEG